MSIRQFIDHLTHSEIGRIYWHNFCIQFLSNLVDKRIARQVFRIASVSPGYRKAVEKGAPKYDVPFAARQAIYSATAENSLAISACKVGSKRPDLPMVVSTVVSAKTFEDHCAKNARELKRSLIAASITLGASPIPALPRSFGLTDVFGELHRRKITRIDNLPGVASTVLPYIVVRTRCARFWLAGDPARLPNDPDAVRDLFGLGYLKPGDWLIRFSLETDTLLKNLGANARLVKRPSAFCVNDDEAPRFRGLTRNDHKSAKGKAVSRWGTTARLDQLAALAMPDDGENEWISPQIALGQDNVRIDILGEVNTPRSKPTNADFEAYLKKELPLTTLDEQTVVDALTT